MASKILSSLQELIEQHASDIPLFDSLLLIAEDEDPTWDSCNRDQIFPSLTKGFYLPKDEEITQSIARLNIHFCQELGFQGDKEDYYHPQNSLIHRVIERRQGLPIILSVLYILIGQSKGLPLVPISFPGHFLVGVRDPVFFIDPFHNGRILRSEHLRNSLKNLPEKPSLSFSELIEPATNLQVLIRINNNLIRAHQQSASPKGMLRAIDRNLLLAPNHTAAHHARYILLRGMGLYLEAADALENFLQHNPDHPQANALTQELASLRGIN